LDASGCPVVSYYDATNGDLKVAHCNDPNCAGGDESLEPVDTVGNYDGSFTALSLVLDPSGHPVISYYDATNGDLKAAHCNDPNCAGGDELLQAVDTLGDVGWMASLVLDASGHAVISYYEGTHGDLKLAVWLG
jgi:hypothetical protein